MMMVLFGDAPAPAAECCGDRCGILGLPAKRKCCVSFDGEMEHTAIETLG